MAKKTKSFKNQSSFDYKKLLIVVLVFAIAGGAIIWRSSAASALTAKVEAEQMTLSNGVSVVSDPTASGGQAVEMLQRYTQISGSFNLAGNLSSVQVRAHAINCYGSDSLMAVYIDGWAVTGTNLKPYVKVSGTDWSVLTFKKFLPKKTSHTLEIKHDILAHIDSPCNNPLYVDYSLISS